MDLLRQFIDFFLHIDDQLLMIADQYGTLTYAILFLIIFCETGLVITPFLPGDSLLFAVGALSAREDSPLNAFFVFALLTIAAILGDTVNYFIGRFFGQKVLALNLPFVKQEYIMRTNHFYEKHGGKTIILARFMPIVRTFAPFVAGVGNMDYSRFFLFNVVGGVLWVALFVFVGFLFGNIPFIQENFEWVAVIIVLLSVLPMVYEWLKSRRERTSAVVGD